MEQSSLLIWGMMFGVVGYGFFSYGRKQKAMVPLVAGLILCVLPYMISDVDILIATGSALALSPLVIRKLTKSRFDNRL